MLEIQNYTKIKKSSEKNFGLVFCSFFAIISLYPLFYNEKIRVWALLISLILLLISFLIPKILRQPNQLWHHFGLFLGKIFTPIIMGIIFFFIVSPTGIIVKILNKDLLNQKLYKAKKSYWKKRTDSNQSMKDQF